MGWFRRKLRDFKMKRLGDRVDRELEGQENEEEVRRKLFEEGAYVDMVFEGTQTGICHEWGTDGCLILTDGGNEDRTDYQMPAEFSEERGGYRPMVVGSPGAHEDTLTPGLRYHRLDSSLRMTIFDFDLVYPRLSVDFPAVEELEAWDERYEDDFSVDVGRAVDEEAVRKMDEALASAGYREEVVSNHMFPDLA